MWLQGFAGYSTNRCCPMLNLARFGMLAARQNQLHDDPPCGPINLRYATSVHAAFVKRMDGSLAQLILAHSMATETFIVSRAS